MFHNDVDKPHEPTSFHYVVKLFLLFELDLSQTTVYIFYLQQGVPKEKSSTECLKQAHHYH